MAHSYRLGLETLQYRFESRSGRIFVIVTVHIQCSKLLKGLECTVLSVVLYTIIDNNLPCKSKMQYLITCKISRYCILALHSSADLSDADRRCLAWTEGDTFIFGKRHVPLVVYDNAHSRCISHILNIVVLVYVYYQVKP